MSEPKYFIKTFDADGETDLSPELSFEQASDWIATEGGKHIFEVVRCVGFTLTDVTDAFARERLYVEAVRAKRDEYIEPLAFLSLL